MKVLLVNSRHFLGGGDSTYTLHLADMLKRKGEKVCFFSMQDSRNIQDPNEDLFVSFIDFREILYQNKPLFNSMKVLSRVIYYPEARKKFSLLLERECPDIIHLQNIHGHISPSILYAARKKKIPVVWTLHDFKQICPNTHFIIDQTGELCEACRGHRFYQAALKKCKKGSFPASLMASIEAYAHKFMRIRNKVDLFISPSRFLKAKFIEYGFPRDKIVHLPLFVSSECFQTANRDKGYMLFMSKLEPAKGIFTLFEACRKAENIKVILAGSLDESLAEEVKKEIPSNAEYVGIKCGRDLSTLITNARAVILPSKWYENQPFSITEAFAFSKPVIASDLGGMRELVNEERGILVPPGNADALADAMIYMDSHSQTVKEMGTRAYQFADEVLSEDVHYRKIRSIYNQLIQ